MPFEECCSRLLRAGQWYGMKSAEPDIIQDVSQHGEFNRRFPLISAIQKARMRVVRGTPRDSSHSNEDLAAVVWAFGSASRLQPLDAGGVIN